MCMRKILTPNHKYHTYVVADRNVSVNAQSKRICDWNFCHTVRRCMCYFLYCKLNCSMNFFISKVKPKRASNLLALGSMWIFICDLKALVCLHLKYRRHFLRLIDPTLRPFSDLHFMTQPTFVCPFISMF